VHCHFCRPATRMASNGGGVVGAATHPHLKATASGGYPQPPPAAAGSAGRKHRTSQAGVGDSRARYRNVKSINRRYASIGVEGRPIRGSKNGTNGVSSNTASTRASCSGSRCNSSGRSYSRGLEGIEATDTRDFLRSIS
jgi:hypothetical protein